MKRLGILNSDIARVLAYMGQTFFYGRFETGFKRYED